jgi:hypothetical protein
MVLNWIDNMKKTEFAIVKEAEGGLHAAIDSSKHDDYELPEFSKEVPSAARKGCSGDTASVEYEWKEGKTEAVLVKRIEYRKDEDALGDVYRIAARDGVDSICFRHDNTTYIMRKTVKEVAQALYNAYGMVRGALESIVGYIKTVLGNYYVVAKAEKDSWAFDKRIAKHGVSFTDVDTLDRKCKARLCEMITEAIAGLHMSNLIIGRFTLNNVILHGNEMRFTDLRKLRVSRRRPFVIEEFKSIMQYLFAIGVATREDVYASIAYYASQNEAGCNEWYEEKAGKKAQDQLDVIDRIEEDIYS